MKPNAYTLFAVCGMSYITIINYSYIYRGFLFYVCVRASCQLILFCGCRRCGKCVNPSHEKQKLFIYIYYYCSTLISYFTRSLCVRTERLLSLPILNIYIPSVLMCVHVCAVISRSNFLSVCRGMYLLNDACKHILGKPIAVTMTQLAGAQCSRKR